MKLNFFKKKRYAKQVTAQGGFVILFTILISVIMLMLGFGIFSLSTKESMLTSQAREAQIAFAAADSGSECALYAEVQSVIGQLLSSTTSGPQTVSCIGEEQTFLLIPSSLPYVESTISFPGGTCARVIAFNDPDPTASGMRMVRSQGYNLCDDEGFPAVGDPRLVERVLEFSYRVAPASVAPGTITSPEPEPLPTP